MLLTQLMLNMDAMRTPELPCLDDLQWEIVRRRYVCQLAHLTMFFPRDFLANARCHNKCCHLLSTHRIL